MSAKPSKAVLCFHGTGSKGSIFNVQMARLCYMLKDEFQFIFLDGPLESAAGPGVLPMFAGQEPYYCWFAGNGTSIDESMKQVNHQVKQQVERWKVATEQPEIEIVGAVGFSEGALALAIMLWQQQEGLLDWQPQLQFAVMSCCFFPNEASQWLTASAQASGKTKALLDVPTVHIHGNRDFCLGRARKLVRNHYQASLATVVQAEAGHHLPTRKEEIEEVVKHMMRLSDSVHVI